MLPPPRSRAGSCSGAAAGQKGRGASQMPESLPHERGTDDLGGRGKGGY